MNLGARASAESLPRAVRTSEVAVRHLRQGLRWKTSGLNCARLAARRRDGNLPRRGDCDTAPLLFEPQERIEQLAAKVLNQDRSFRPRSVQLLLKLILLRFIRIALLAPATEVVPDLRDMQAPVGFGRDQQVLAALGCTVFGRIQTQCHADRR